MISLSMPRLGGHFRALVLSSSDPAVGLLASFGIYFLGFAVPPLGGVSLGSWATSLGENSSCWSTVILMGLASNKRV
jgi:MHS family metabolite:H+ symporter-like MFS transporter